ncbi:uncharacterized protein LOC126745051 [Anthonomus grandis grandis]|uniref:uncharacterized protein LOC126745051 n=1 Tax=Anthonomus grandis grandis TaxID=2921223 RepID=UPI0021663BBF|nr:uncharacterized protein LOC126745051 [Anthonomus grandis grandis]
MTTEENSDSGPSASNTSSIESKHKPSKRGIIYLSTIPPYMNVTKIREIFGQFGKVGRVYLQLSEKESALQDKKKESKRKIAKKFTEGWVEFEKKVVAKRVASLLNQTQVSTRKKSKHYDCHWNIKYLSNFKWTHLHERLAYERAARSKKLKAEITLAKKKTNFFTANLDKKKKNVDVVNKEFENMDDIATEAGIDVEEDKKESRNEFLQSLFS